MHTHFPLTGKPDKVPSYSSDISSVAPSFAGVMDGSFSANVKICFPSFRAGTSVLWSCTHVLAHRGQWSSNGLDGSASKLANAPSLSTWMTEMTGPAPHPLPSLSEYRGSSQSQKQRVFASGTPTPAAFIEHLEGRGLGQSSALHAWGGVK